jgi:hypothetical protein
VTTTEHPAKAPPNRHERRQKATAVRHRNPEEGAGDPLESGTFIGAAENHATAAEYVDEAGLSEKYLIPPRTAQRWRGSGAGPPFVRLGPRRVLYRIADVEAWLATRTYRSRADELARQSAA